MAVPDFIKSIIASRFNNPENQSSTTYWDESISKLSEKQFYLLITVCLEAIGVKQKQNEISEIIRALKTGVDFFVSCELYDDKKNFNISFLHNILDCIVISEYRIDSLLLLPAELRFNTIDKISASIGIETALLIQVDNYWRQKNVA